MLDKDKKDTICDIELRCECGRLLGKVAEIASPIEIKCPRCKKVTMFTSKKKEGFNLTKF